MIDEGSDVTDSVGFADPECTDQRGSERRFSSSTAQQLDQHGAGGVELEVLRRREIEEDRLPVELPPYDVALPQPQHRVAHHPSDTSGHCSPTRSNLTPALATLIIIAVAAMSGCSAGASHTARQPPPVASPIPISQSVPAQVRHFATGAASQNFAIERATRFVTPQGSGRRTGTSVADAASWAQLPRLVAHADAGQVIGLVNSAGPYPTTEPVELLPHGAPKKPIVVTGVNPSGAPAPVTIVGNRTTPYRPEAFAGTELFRLGPGSAHFLFANLKIRSTETAFRLTGPATDGTFEDIEASNVRRFFLNLPTRGQQDASVLGLTLRRLTVLGFSKDAFRIGGNSTNILMEGVVCDSEHEDGDSFAEGIHLVGSVHRVLIRDTRAQNTTDTLGTYWNGDGFATEADVRDVAFVRTAATDNTDAGYDLKSKNTWLISTSASDNKRNYRLWGSAELVDCAGTSPRRRGGAGNQVQVWLAPHASVRVSGCTFSDRSSDTVVFDVGPAASLNVVSTRVTHSALGTVEVRSPGSSLTMRNSVVTAR